MTTHQQKFCDDCLINFRALTIVGERERERERERKKERERDNNTVEYIIMSEFESISD